MAADCSSSTLIEQSKAAAGLLSGTMRTVRRLAGDMFTKVRMIKPDSGEREKATAKPGKTPVPESLRPKRRSRVVEQSPPPDAVLPAPASSDRTRPARIKRSGQPQQNWKEPQGRHQDLDRPIPSKALGTRQIIEWLVRSPFASSH